MVNKLTIELNNRISKGESYAIVEKNVFSVKVLYILQRNNFIGSFFSINVDKILVNFRFLSFRHNVINQVHCFQRRGSIIKKKKKVEDKKGIARNRLKLFTIVSTRYGLMSNRKAALLNIEGIPLIAVN